MAWNEMVRSCPVDRRTSCLAEKMTALPRSTLNNKTGARRVEVIPTVAVRSTLLGPCGIANPNSARVVGVVVIIRLREPVDVPGTHVPVLTIFYIK
jgi:hypothetical protein